MIVEGNDNHVTEPDSHQQRRVHLLRSGEPYSVHESAQKFTTCPEDMHELRKSLSDNGQLVPGIAMVRDGELVLLDGKTRCLLQHERGEPFLYRLINPSDLDVTISEFILRQNLNEPGRHYSTVDRIRYALSMLDIIQQEALARKREGRRAHDDAKGSTAFRLAAISRVVSERTMATLISAHKKHPSVLKRFYDNEITANAVKKIIEAKEKPKQKKNPPKMGNSTNTCLGDVKNVDQNHRQTDETNMARGARALVIAFEIKVMCSDIIEKISAARLDWDIKPIEGFLGDIDSHWPALCVNCAGTGATNADDESCMRCGECQARGFIHISLVPENEP